MNELNPTPEPNPTPEKLEQLTAEIEAFTTQQLRVELARGLQLTAQHFVRLALIVKVLESRGEDLSSLKVGSLLHHLRRIACGQMLPELLVRFAATPLLIAKVGCLPITDQQQIAAGQGVRLLVYSPTGEATHRMADPIAMSGEQVKQAFDSDHIRNEAEQSLWLDERRTRSRTAPDRVGELRIDRVLGGAYLGKKFIPQADLVAAVAALRRKSAEEPH